MSRYRKVDPRMWGDAKFRRLSHNAQRVWFYLLTGPETTSLPGLIVAGPSALAEAVGLEPKAFREAFGEALREGMAKADFEARLVWLPKAAGYNAPESPNVVRSWRGHWDSVPECPLKCEAFQALRAFAEGLGEAFAKAFREACAQPSPNQYQEQEQEQEQKEEKAPDGPAPVPFGETVEGRVWSAYLAERARAIGTRGAKVALTRKRLTMLRSRAKDSTEDELLTAVRTMWSSQWHIEQRQTSPELLFRDRERVEFWLSRSLNAAGRTSEAEHADRKTCPLPVVRQLLAPPPDEPLRLRPTPTKVEHAPKTERAPETEADRERRIEAERSRALDALAAMGAGQ